jgi:hypothetical protein
MASSESFPHNVTTLSPIFSKNFFESFAPSNFSFLGVAMVFFFFNAKFLPIKNHAQIVCQWHSNI